MSTSIQSRANRSRKYRYGAGSDPVAASYRSARENLRAAREFKAMYDAIKNVPGQKRRKQIYLEGYLEALKNADYWRNDARWSRRHVPTHLRTR